MKVIPEMRHLHYLPYLRFYVFIRCTPCFDNPPNYLSSVCLRHTCIWVFAAVLALLYYYRAITKMNRRYIVLTYIFTKALT